MQLIQHPALIPSRDTALRMMNAAASQSASRREAGTERNDKMREVQKLAAVGVAASGIAHDLVNLMTGVRGFGELALMPGATEEKVHSAIEKIMAIADRAAEMCKQVLSCAVSRTGQPRYADLSQLAAEVIEMVRWRMGKKAKVEVNLCCDLPRIAGNVSQISQVLMNLIINASDALKGEDGVVRVRTGIASGIGEDLGSAVVKPSHREGEMVFIEIADTGCGMPADVLAKIFQPFFTTKSTGQGLGLAAVAGIIQEHGGALQVWSEVGKGTTFRVVFPIADRAMCTPECPVDRV